MNLTYEIIYKKEFLRDDDTLDEFRLVRVCEKDKIGSEYSVYPSTRRIDGIWKCDRGDDYCYFVMNYSVPDSYELDLIKKFNEKFMVGDLYEPGDQFFIEVTCEFEGILMDGHIF